MNPTDYSKPNSIMERLSHAQEVVRMNFDEALLAHAEWKLKLHLFLQGEGDLDANVVGRDDQCKLGKWIYSDGMKYANDPDYESLRSSHGRFHKHTAEIIRSAENGERARARAMLAPESEYETISAAVNRAISQMKLRVDEKTNLIMGNVAVGVLVVDATLIVQSGYSNYCHDLLSARRVGGRHICELLRLERTQFEFVESALRQAFEDVLPPEVSLAMLPERVPVGSRVVGVRAAALRSTGQEMDYIIFTLDDATRLVELEAEHAEGLAMIRALRNRHAFALFARDAHDRLTELLSGRCDTISIRRDVHTIKGNAGLFDLKSVVRCASEIEEESEIRRADLERLKHCLDSTLDHFQSVLGFNLVEEEQKSSSCDEATLQGFERDYACAPDEPTRARLFQSLVKRLRMRPVRSILGPIEERIALLADRLEKKVKFRVSGEKLLVNEHKLGPVLQALAHAIRNAIDHGIEQHEERIAKAKAPEGNIVLCFDADDHHGLKLELSDDGRGIDLAEITRRAITQGLVAPEALADMSAEQQLQLVFLDGVSTSRSVTEISGRGVGMSALKTAVERIGGSLRLQSEPSQGTRIEITIADAALSA